MKMKSTAQTCPSTYARSPGNPILMEKWKSGGEGGILLPPFPAIADESYTSVIILCVLAGYKRIRSSATVSIVSLIRWSSAKNGITGIS